MNKNSNLIFILLFVAILGVGVLVGVIAGTQLFDLAFPQETTSDNLESTSDSQSTGSSSDKPVDQTPKKMIALTFDDGPNSENTAKILDLLEQYDAQATFFVCGSNVTISTRTVLRRAISLGCEIGNHTLSHKDMKTLSKQELLKEILDTNEKIALHSGTDYQCKVYRPPYGNINLSAMNTLYDNDVRMYSIHWSSDSLDWEYQSRYKKGEITREAAIDGAFQTIVNETGEGTVILMHDIHEITPDILKLVLEKYTAEGYTFVTVSELFGLEDNAPKEAYFKRYRSTSSILDTTK
jgi:peptidoglycan/xylan/chitin deacetylase (PgdA/CDA1 family)